MKPISALKAVMFVATLAGVASPAASEPVADFYKNGTINLLIATAAGGGYDLEGRLIGRHLGKHIPGSPNIVPQNMPGAGGVRAANHLYNAAPKDGTHLALLLNSTAMMQAIGGQGVRFDTTKFHWIGSAAPAVDTMAVWHSENVNSVGDARTKVVTSAAQGKGANSSVIPTAMNELLGTKFRVVTGYQGANEMNLAMERGEAGARGNSWASWKTTKADWLKDKKIVIIAYIGPKPSDLPGVPSMLDLAKSDDDRRILQIVFSGTEFGRPLTFGPDVPPTRVQAMRAAFNATMADKGFLAEAEKLKIDVEPVRGEYLQEIAAKLMATPKHLAERAKAIVE